MHLQQPLLNVLPTKKEATPAGTMAIPAAQTALLAAVRLLRALLTEHRRHQSAGTRVLDRRRKQRAATVLRGHHQGAESGDDEERVPQRILSGGQLLRRRCPVHVLVHVGGQRQQQPDLCGRGVGGEGVSRIPGQSPGPAATGDVAGECCKGSGQQHQQCLCADPAAGGDELERGPARDCVSHVALDGFGHADGFIEARSQLPEWSRSRVHLLQSQPLVPGATTR